MERVKNYLDTVAGLVMNAPVEDIHRVANLVLDAYRNEKQVFILGNGGSASTSSHMACDLQKSMGLYGDKKFKVMALTDSVPLITAWANDFDYPDIFVQQLSTWLAPDDLAIAISGSGNSPNVIKAIEYANAKGAISIGISGFDGGKLANIARYNIITPSDNMQHIEDVHMMLAHLIFRYVLEATTADDSIHR